MLELMPIQKEAFRLILRRMLKKTTRRDSILDLGCGRGDFLELMDATGLTVGLEVDKRIAKVAMSRTGFRPNICIVIYNGVNLPFVENAFDFVYSVEVIEHIKDDEPLLSEVYRVTNNGGSFVLSTPNRNKEPLNISHHHGHTRHYDSLEIINKLNHAGFTDFKLYWRIHPTCSLLDNIITGIGNRFLHVEEDFGQNVRTLSAKKQEVSSGTRLLLRLYSIVEPLLVGIVVFEWLLFRRRMEAKNMIVIARNSKLSLCMK